MAVTEKTIVDKTTKELVFPLMVTPARPPAVQVIMVGAGGTGARLLSPLVKMLHQGDRIDVIDHDIVESRNLLRQHFTEKHLNQNKAEVAISRLRSEARRGGLTLAAWPAKATADSLKGVMAEGRGFGARIILGCVDNREARKDMEAAYKTVSPSAWLDAGNETSGGQVVLSLFRWPIWELGQAGKMLWKADRSILRPDFHPEGFVSCDTLRLVIPALLEPQAKTPEELEAEACAIRIDAQTVSANQMAAALMTNILGWLFDEIPFCNPGAFFSTLNTVKPIMFNPAGVYNDGSNSFNLSVAP